MQSDQLFKEFLKEFLPQFLTLFFPEEAAQLNWNSVRFLDKEMFTDILVGDVREADLIAEVQTNRGEPELILLHIEVQAKRSPDFSRRMWEYFSLISQRYGKDIFPVVVYLAGGSGGLVEEQYIKTVLGRERLRFTYSAVGLPDLSADEWVGRGGAVSAALATLMAAPKARRAMDSLKIVVQSPLSDIQKLILAEIVERLGQDRLSRREKEIYAELRASEEAGEIDAMISMYEERGIEKGIEKGIERGTRETLVRMVSHQLARKLGSEASTLTASVSGLSTLNLEILADALLDFTSVSEAREWLQKRIAPSR